MPLLFQMSVYQATLPDSEYCGDLRLCPARRRVLHSLFCLRHPVAARADCFTCRLGSLAADLELFCRMFPPRLTRQGAADDPRNASVLPLFSDYLKER